MHLATQVNESMFALTLEGRPATRAEVLPGWGAASRLGILVNEPFGAIGASLLIQLAVTSFYDAEPSRRTEAPQYPEIYLFHVGGRYGDHRPLDFWPPRKEVFTGRDSLEVLEAINDRAITALALPSSLAAASQDATAELEASGAPWSEINSFCERTTASFLYSSNGKVSGSDLAIRALDDVLERSVERATEPRRSLDWYRNLRPEQLPTALPGPGTLAQTQYWARSLLDRFDEVGAEGLAQAQARRRQRLADGKPIETYQRITAEQALALL
jgi:hypothetical protein